MGILFCLLIWEEKVKEFYGGWNDVFYRCEINYVLFIDWFYLYFCY